MMYLKWLNERMVKNINCSSTVWNSYYLVSIILFYAMLNLLLVFSFTIVFFKLIHCTICTAQSLSLFPCQVLRGVRGSSSLALNSTDLLSEWQTQQMLTLSNTQWLLSPPAFALLWFLDEVSRLATWLWRTVLFVCYVTNRCASGVPYQTGLMLTSIPSTRCISLSCCRLLTDTS